jgi:hypothetical protein
MGLTVSAKENLSNRKDTNQPELFDSALISSNLSQKVEFPGQWGNTVS